MHTYGMSTMTDGEKSHIRIWYEIRSDSLIPVDTLYWHDGMEF